jgi:lipid A 4'-phosphatase
MIIRLYLALVLLAAGFFTAYAKVDIAVSRLFWNAQQGFYLRDNFLAVFLYQAIPLLAYASAGFALLVLGISLFRPRARLWVDRKSAVFLLLALVAGPGLVTNAILKDHWGRARPFQIEEFGGKSEFTPALQITDQCYGNCSFVAGHPSMAFYLIAFALLVRDPLRRKFAIAASIAFGLLAGYGRVVQGAHFFSDVIFSGLINCGLIWLLHRWIVQKDALGRFLSPPSAKGHAG